MRTVLAVVLGTAAFACAAFAVPALWVERNVVDESGYVELVQPLGGDADFQAALAEAVTDAIIANSSIPRRVATVVRPAVAATARRLSGLEGYATAWTKVNKLSHRALFVDREDLPADARGSDRLILDITPVAQLVLDQVNQATGQRLTAPKNLTVQVGGTNERQIVDRLKSLDPWAFIVAAGAIVLAVLSILVARRRTTAVAVVGLATLLLAGLLKLVADHVVPAVVDRNTQSTPIGGSVQDYLQDAATASFGHWLLVLAIGGAVLAVAGGVGRGLSGSRA